MMCGSNITPEGLNQPAVWATNIEVVVGLGDSGLAALHPLNDTQNAGGMVLLCV